MDTVVETNDDGDAVVRTRPAERPRPAPALWLGTHGTLAEQVYHAASGEYRQTGLGDADDVLNRDRTLAGLVRHLADR